MIQELSGPPENSTFVGGEYDMTLKIAGTTIHIIAPKITEEEKGQRLDEINNVIRTLWNKNYKHMIDDHYTTDKVDEVQYPN